MDFQSSKALTCGLEIELQIVDQASGRLSPASAELWPELQRQPAPERFALEATRSTIEVTSSIHQDTDTMAAEMRQLVGTVRRIAQTQGLDLRGGGTHILQFWNERIFTATDRAQELKSKYGFLPKRFSTYGVHVHIGVPDKAAAIQLANAMQALGPLFIALAAASPFQQGVDTGFCAARPLEPLVYPYGGPMPRFKSWAELEQVLDEIVGSGLAKGIKDIYWDVRPKPEFGTVEVRVFDTPLRVEKAVALAAFTRGCAALALDGQLLPMPLPTPYRAERLSRFLACRDGMAARLYNPMTGDWVAARDWLHELVRRIEKHSLGAADLRRVHELQQLAAGEQDSDIMRAAWNRITHGSAHEAATNGGPEYAQYSCEHSDRLLS